MPLRLRSSVLAIVAVVLVLTGSAPVATAAVTRLDTPLIHTMRQANRLLPDTTRDFRRAVAIRGHRNFVYAQETCDGDGGIGVQVYDSRGFALVDTFGCGGALEIWSRTDKARWVIVTGTQDLWDCRKLLKRSVPKSVVKPNTCAPASGTRSLPYRPRSDGSQYAS